MTSFIDKFKGPGKGGDNASFIKALFALLTVVQANFVLSASRYKVARCGRRSGKTYLAAVYLIITCLREARTPTLYAGLTRDSAKEAVWATLLNILGDLGVPHQAKESTLQIIFQNGSKIVLFGCDMANARNRLRGRKFKLTIFDETGFYTGLDPLVDAMLPTLADYGGTLCLMSSPGELLQGLFYRADQGQAEQHWDRYTWTIHDNPFFQKPALDPKFKTRAEEEIANALHTKYKGDDEDPDFRREWLGEWVRNEKVLVYPTEAMRNVFDDIKTLKIMHPDLAVAVNLAHPFITSVIVGRFSEFSRHLAIEEQTDYEDLTMDQVAEKLRETMERTKASVLIGYIGDYTKDMAQEFKRRYKLPLIVLNNRDISYHQRVYAADLIKGNIQIKRGLQVLEEHGTIVKDKNGVEIEGQVNHASNTCLALHRRIYQTHLSRYEAPLSEEERHIKQLEEQVGQEDTPWYNR